MTSVKRPADEFKCGNDAVVTLTTGREPAVENDDDVNETRDDDSGDVIRIASVTDVNGDVGGDVTRSESEWARAEFSVENDNVVSLERASLVALFRESNDVITENDDVTGNGDDSCVGFETVVLSSGGGWLEIVELSAENDDVSGSGDPAVIVVPVLRVEAASC